MMMMMMMMMIIIIIIIVIIISYWYYDYDSDSDRWCALLHVCYIWKSIHAVCLWSEVEAADFCPKFGWPWKMDSSVWCYRVCNENGGASFSTQINAAYGPRHCFTMRELNYCKLGVASLAETFFGVLCFGGGKTLIYSENSPENDPYDPKREAVFQEISQRFCAFRAPFSSIFHFSVSDLPWLWEGPGRTLIMFDPSVQSWGESWKNEQKMKPLTPSDEISRRSSWVLRCLVESSPRMGAFL